jgi:hypothetical protein
VGTAAVFVAIVTGLGAVGLWTYRSHRAPVAAAA